MPAPRGLPLACGGAGPAGRKGAACRRLRTRCCDFAVLARTDAEPTPLPGVAPGQPALRGTFEQAGSPAGCSGNSAANLPGARRWARWVHPEEGGVRGRWSGHGRVRDPGARGCEGPAGSAGDALLGVAGRDTDERCVVALRTSGSQAREPGIRSREHSLRPVTSQSFSTAAREQKIMVRGKHLYQQLGSRNLPRKSSAWLSYRS